MLTCNHKFKLVFIDFPGWGYCNQCQNPGCDLLVRPPFAVIRRHLDKLNEERAKIRAEQVFPNDVK